MQTESSYIEKSLFQSEGFVLLILTATTYTAFLIREMGYADYFSIPQEIITTSHVGLVSAAKALIWGVMAYIGKVNLVWIFAPRGDRMLISFLRHAIGIGLIIGFAMYPYLTTNFSWWWFVGLFSFFIFFWFIWPLITQRHIPGYENKVAEQARIDSQGHDIYALLFARFGQATRITVICIASIMVFAYGDGRRSAFVQEEYNLLESESNVALLRIYGDVAVFSAFDPKTHELNGMVRIGKIPDGKGIEIRRTHIGRLKNAAIK